MKKISDILPKIREHVVMRDYNTFKVGGVADYFLEVKEVDELVKAVRTAFSLKIPYFILGNGSNILFSDYGFPGLVIKNSTSNIAIMQEKSQAIVDSGVMLGQLIMKLASADLGGLEFLYGIPGTVGGATYGNAGAWGSTIGDYLKNITLLESDPETGIPKIVQCEASWMDFGYRTSKLKKMKNINKPVILTVRLQLARSQKEEIMRKLNVYQSKRGKSQPIGHSAGSIFKNPIPKELTNVTGAGTKNMPEFAKERTAGYLLEASGAKKSKVGLAEVSNAHANFIVNHDGAKAADIRTLIEEMREKVNQKFGIILEEEIEYIGQW